MIKITVSCFQNSDKKKTSIYPRQSWSFPFFIHLYILTSLMARYRTCISKIWLENHNLLHWLHGKYTLTSRQPTYKWICKTAFTDHILFRQKVTLCRTSYTSMPYYLTNRRFFNSNNHHNHNHHNKGYKKW